MKRKTIVCIFAHPDDEAFGPGGTIAKFAKTNDVYVICATKGEAGKNHSGQTKELGEIRGKELLKSAKILGVKKVYFLGYKDGTLCNNLYHEIAEKIEKILKKLRPQTLLSYEPRGVSGHIDHITIAMVTLFVFRNLKFVKRVMQYCTHKEISSLSENYFIYFPQGYEKRDVDLVVDTSEVWEIKQKAMRTHKSQTHDVERIINMYKDRPKEEYFLLVKR